MLYEKILDRKNKYVCALKFYIVMCFAIYVAYMFKKVKSFCFKVLTKLFYKARGFIFHVSNSLFRAFLDESKAGRPINMESVSTDILFLTLFFCSLSVEENS